MGCQFHNPSFGRAGRDPEVRYFESLHSGGNLTLR